MKYKQFGIYTNDTMLTIFVKVTGDSIIGVFFDIYDFPELSNHVINEKLFADMNIEFEQVFEANMKDHPNQFKDYGYLGQITDLNVQDDLIGNVEIILEWI